MKIKNYIAIARPDNWAKHIFIIPGIILAIILIEPFQGVPYFNILIGILSACLLASANYVINEWLDAEFDSFHPIKKNRPAPSGLISGRIVYIEYFSLIIVGLILASFVNLLFLFVSVAFIISGVFYNIRPFRFKDIAYLDVLVESFNNPIRLMLGWAIVSTDSLPPASIIVFFWFGGAFLMSAKRLGEIRHMIKTGNLNELIKYRPIFKHYTEKSLILILFLYGIFSSFNIAVFLIKYRPEFILVYPAIAILFVYYFYLTLRDYSIVQNPELLYKDKGLLFVLLLLIISFLVFSFVDVPFVRNFLDSKIIVFDIPTNLKL